MPFTATWMDLEVVILSEVSQTEKDKYDITYMWNPKKKMVQMKLFTKQKYSHRCRKQTQLQGGEVGGWMNSEIGTDMYTLLYIKQITNKDLLYSRGNATRYSVTTYMGK